MKSYIQKNQILDLSTMEQKMLENEQGYGLWATTYDEIDNITRDLEYLVARKLLGSGNYQSILELGCGTGKNSEWLSQLTLKYIGIDFSGKMLEKAMKKIKSDHVHLMKRDLLKPWDFNKERFDLITSSLFLEHVENLEHIFCEVEKVLISGGVFYLCELHPYKQYLGSKAHFSQDGKSCELECYTHHISDYLRTAKKHNLELLDLDEWFEGKSTEKSLRLLSIIFRKS